MKVRSQLFLILLAVVFGITTLSLLLKVKISNETRSLLEQRITDTREQDAPRVFNLNAAHIKGYTYDYSVRGQMVDFVTVNKNLDWAKEDLDKSLSNYDIDYIWVLDSNAREYYYSAKKYEDSVSGIKILSTKLKNGLTVRKFTSFHILYNNSLVEVFPAPIQPITDKKRETKPKGFLLLGRVVDSTYVNNLKSISPEISFSLVDNKSAFRDNSNPAKGDLELSIPLKDFDGNSLAAFNITRKYPVLGSYQKYLNKYLIFFLLIIVFIGILFYEFVKKILVTPLACLSDSLKNNSPEKLAKYKNIQNEFGDLSRLIISSFGQNKALQDEIETRKNSENALIKALAEKEAAKSEQMKAEDFLNQQLSMLKLNTSINDLGFDEIIKETIAHGANIINCERVGIWLYNDDEKAIKADKIYQLSKGKYIDGETLYEKDFPVYFGHLKKDVIIVANDAHTHPATAEFTEVFLKPKGITSMMDVPIRSADKIIGIVCYEHTGPQREWSITEQVFARSLSDIIAITFERKERSRVEEELKKSQTRFEETQELAHIGSWEFNIISKKFYCSKEFYRILDLNNSFANEILEKYYKNIHQDDASLIEKELQQVIADGEVRSIEFRIVNPDNSIKYILGIAEPVRSTRQQKIVGVRGTVQDITRQKLATMAKSDFLSCMSHEIRTPINGVIGIANLLQEENLTEKQREYVRTLNFSAQHLSTVVSDILDFSKIESGHMTFENVSFNLENNCRYIYQLFSLKAAEKNLRFTFYPAIVDNFSLYGDYVRLNQVLSNLLSNAIKFTDHGTVDFSYKIKKQTEDKVTVIFSVKDSGIGIPEKHQATIFDSFTQADETITRQYGGTGLGLTICKKLVELQGGKISVKSKPGVGTEFFVELTFDNHVYEEKAGIKMASAEKTQLKDLSGLKILVAEDNHVNAMVLTRFLTKWNVESKVAKDGSEALDYLDREQFDVILMDIQMPNLDGIEATKIIRQLEKETLKNIPVVAFTADASVDTHRELLKIGFNHCITKPFNPESLFSFLKKNYHAA